MELTPLIPTPIKDALENRRDRALGELYARYMNIKSPSYMNDDDFKMGEQEVWRLYYEAKDKQKNS